MFWIFIFDILAAVWATFLTIWQFSGHSVLEVSGLRLHKCQVTKLSGWAYITAPNFCHSLLLKNDLAMQHNNLTIVGLSQFLLAYNKLEYLSLQDTSTQV